MTAAHDGLPYPRRLIAIIALVFGGLVLMIDASIAAIVLPTIARELDVSAANAVFIVTAYQLVLAMGLMPLAALGHRIGLHCLYCSGLLLHCLGALLCFACDTLPALVAARSLQALGTAAAMSVSMGLVRFIYPPQQLGKGMAINTIANASGTALAPLVGGFILGVASWHWVFSAAIPFALFALLFSRALPRIASERQAFDLSGAVMCALTIGMVIGGLEIMIRSDHWLLSLMVLAAGAVMAAVFVRHELKVPLPVLPVDLLARPILAIALLSNFLAVLASMTLLLYIPFRLQYDYGFDPQHIGTVLASYALASVMVAPASGYLSDRVPVSILCTLGILLAAVGLLSVCLLPEQPQQLDFAWRLWLCGAGFGMFFSPNARQLIDSAPLARAASAGSMLTTSRILGQACGATLVAGLMALQLGETIVPILVALVLVVVVLLFSVWRLFDMLRARQQQKSSD